MRTGGFGGGGECVTRAELRTSLRSSPRTGSCADARGGTDRSRAATAHQRSGIVGKIGSELVSGADDRQRAFSVNPHFNQREPPASDKASRFRNAHGRVLRELVRFFWQVREALSVVSKRRATDELVSRRRRRFVRNRIKSIRRLRRYHSYNMPGGRDDSSLSLSFQDRGHGMTTERRTMTFFRARTQACVVTPVTLWCLDDNASGSFLLRPKIFTMARFTQNMAILRRNAARDQNGAARAFTQSLSETKQTKFPTSSNFF